MIIVHDFVIAAALIAVLMLLQFRRMRSRPVSATSDAPMNWDAGFPQPRHENSAFSIPANASGRHQFPGDRPGLKSLSDVVSFRPSLPRRRPSIRARLG